MAKRFKIGLIYTENKDWIAGSYYVINLIHALNTLSDESKPQLIILSFSPEEFNAPQNTGYPYLKFFLLNEKEFWVSYTLYERIVNKISRVFLKRNIFSREQTYKRLKLNLDVLFPATTHVYFSEIKNRLFWIPDFQEHFLPHFFSKEEIERRKLLQLNLSKQKNPIVFSSKNAMSHFQQFYPNSIAKPYVLQFAVTHPDFSTIAPQILFEKYNIKKPYFFCPNQVWAHKNHITVLKSLWILKSKGIDDLLVVFSGKETDYRNPEFHKELKKYVTDHGLEENVKFLGFIAREDQLQLMNQAISVIQPSLFEGWSTVVEDAKAMNQYVLASNLEVHKEQLKENVSFFNPLDPEELSKLIESCIRTKPLKIKNDYANNIRIFGETYIEIINVIVQGK